MMRMRLIAFNVTCKFASHPIQLGVPYEGDSE